VREQMSDCRSMNGSRFGKFVIFFFFVDLPHWESHQAQSALSELTLSLNGDEILQQSSSWTGQAYCVLH
jgi:hypothetical protein